MRHAQVADTGTLAALQILMIEVNVDLTRLQLLSPNWMRAEMLAMNTQLEIR